MTEKAAIHKEHRTLLSIIRNRLAPLQIAWRVMLLRQLGVELESDCEIGAAVETTLGFVQGRYGRLYFGHRTVISTGSIFNAYGGEIIIGENTFIGPYSVIYGHGGVYIGNDTLLAAGCRIFSSNHTIPSRESRIREHPDILLPVHIGDDVWLGAGVTVLGGVRIGDGCVVGAGAVVSKNLPPYSIAVGVPAKVLRKRT